jgi:hypothetical protein
LNSNNGIYSVRGWWKNPGILHGPLLFNYHFQAKNAITFSVYRCLSKVYYEKIVTQPDIDAVIENNYCIQIIETGFAEWLQASQGWSLYGYFWKYLPE